MAENAQLLKLGGLLEAARYDEAAVMVKRMLDLFFANIGKLFNLLHKYPPLDIAPYNYDGIHGLPRTYADINNYYLDDFINGRKCFPYMRDIADFEIFDNHYFMGYHTYVRENILYDFKINRGYFIVLKYVIGAARPLAYIGGVKRQFDALYDYCKVIKPNYYLTLNIGEEGPNIVIKVSYKEQPIINVIYSDAEGDRLSEGDRAKYEGAREYPPPDYNYIPQLVYSERYNPIRDMPAPSGPMPYEREIITIFNNHQIVSYFNPQYSQQEKTNYCHSNITKIQ